MNCAIVLAAGKSTRMGARKVLLPLGGSTAIERIVDRLAGSRLDRLLVVVGREGDAVREALRGRNVAIAVNPEVEGDMLSSVRCGLRALPGGCRGILVALGDQPRISTAVVDALLCAFEAGPKGIVVPVHRGKRGHPLLFSACYRSEVLERHDGVGLRGLLDAHPQDVLELGVEEEWVLSDMDDLEGYRRERAALEAEGPPG